MNLRVMRKIVNAALKAKVKVKAWKFEAKAIKIWPQEVLLRGQHHS